MKRNLSLAVFALFIVGCATLNPNADPIVVRAEQTAELATATMDTFVHWEYDNRAAVPKEVTQVADAIRHQAPAALKSLRALTKAYKANRTDQNKASLVTAQAIVETMMAEAQKWLATYKKG